MNNIPRTRASALRLEWNHYIRMTLLRISKMISVEKACVGLQQVENELSGHHHAAESNRFSLNM